MKERAKEVSFKKPDLDQNSQNGNKPRQEQKNCLELDQIQEPDKRYETKEDSNKRASSRNEHTENRKCESREDKNKSSERQYSPGKSEKSQNRNGKSKNTPNKNSKRKNSKNKNTQSARKNKKLQAREIKAVVCDLDGTLLNNESELSGYTRKTIQKLREKGLKFGLCTGRPVSGLPRLLKKWKIEDLVDFVIGFNGGSLIELKKLNSHEAKDKHENNKRKDEFQNEHQNDYTIIEQDCSLSKEQIEEVFELFDKFHANYCAYHGDEIWSEKAALAPYFMSRRNGLKFKKKNKEDLIRESQKIMITAAPAKISKILREARKDPRSAAFNFFRSGPFLIEILHPELSKARGIEKIARLYNIEDKEILAFGNDNNDLEMLEKATGVAMKNALPSLKEKADYITEESNDRDGVARFLEKFFSLG